MSEIEPQTKRLKVKATPELFAKNGSSFSLHEIAGGPYKFSQGVPKRGDRPAIEEVTSHEIVLTHAQAQGLVHDGYDIPGFSRWHEEPEKFDQPEKKK